MPKIVYDKDEFLIELNQGQQQLLKLIATKSKPDVSAKAKDELIAAIYEQIKQQQNNIADSKSATDKNHTDDKTAARKKASSAVAYEFVAMKN